MLLRDEVNERNGEKEWTEAALKEKIKAHDDEEDIKRRQNRLLSLFKKKDKMVKDKNKNADVKKSTALKGKQKK